MTIPSKMAGVLARQSGKPAVLEYTRDLKVPSPGAGELLVKTSAVGVNMIDTYRRSGLYPAVFPHIPGGEGTGIVLAHGEGDDLAGSFPVGSRVAFLTGGFGAYAQYVAVPAATTIVLPDSVPDDIGAALLLQGLTAHYLVTDIGRVQPGDAVLVHAGAGGTGRLISGLCRAAGATTIIATTSTPEKAEIALNAGATHVIRSDTCEDLAGEVRELTGGEGVRVAFDGVGKATFRQSLAALRRRGVLALFGNASGAVPPIDPLDLTKAGSITLCRPKLQDYIATRKEFTERASALMASLSPASVAAGDEAGETTGKGVSLLVGMELSLFDAQLSHELLESRRTHGKVVLLPQEGVDPGTPIPDRRSRKEGAVSSRKGSIS